MYPQGTTYLKTYTESRGTDQDGKVIDVPITWLGHQIFVNKLAELTITKDDAVEAREFYKEHFLGADFFPYDDFRYMIERYDGKFAARIKAVPEGTTLMSHNVVATCESTDERLPWITSFLETMTLRASWYGPSVATRDMLLMAPIYDALMKSSDDPMFYIANRNHDFGARGSACSESAQIAGAVHALISGGSDTLEGIYLANKLYNAKMSAFSIPACYDKETEILTFVGFKKFEDLNPTDLVAQYSNDGLIEFVAYSNYVNSDYDGPMMQFSTLGNVGKVDLLVTPNHRMVRKSIGTGNIEIQEAQKIKFSQRNVWLQGGKAVEGHRPFDDWDRLRIAFQADGSFASHASDYTGERKNTIPIRFSLKKNRKKERLENVLNNLGLEYTKANEGGKPGYTRYWIPIPIDHAFSKTFDWVKFDSVCYSWCENFISELQYWDGCKKSATICYSTTVRANADVVQTIGALADFRATLSKCPDKRETRKLLFTVLLSPKSTRNGQGIIKQSVPYKGKIYCVTVPSGMLVVRRHNTISISGNSEHSVTTAYGEENEGTIIEASLNNFPGAPLVANVADSYDFKHFIDVLVGQVYCDAIIASGKFYVARPDSGDAYENVGFMLESFDKNFGSTINSKGYKVLNVVRIINGDGNNAEQIRGLCAMVLSMGFSMDNLAFGTGGWLHSGATRDTYRWATKLCLAKINGVLLPIRKAPKTDPTKGSRAGDLDLIQVGGDFKTIDRLVDTEYTDVPSSLEMAYENGNLGRQYTRDDVQARILATLSK
jgi:nicotinic acid phosphoribosyltransferase